MRKTINYETNDRNHKTKDNLNDVTAQVWKDITMENIMGIMIRNVIRNYISGQKRYPSLLEDVL